MVCLTTFSDTLWVISHSVIIFHTFYGSVRRWGVRSLGGRPTCPPHLFPSPFHDGINSFGSLSTSLSLNTPCSVIRSPHLSGSFLRVQPPASDSIGDKLAFSCTCGGSRRRGVMYKPLCSNVKGKKKKKMEREAGALGTINYGTLTSGSCQLLEAASPKKLNTVFVTFTQMVGKIGII